MITTKMVYTIDVAGALCPYLLAETPGIGYQMPDNAVDLGRELTPPVEGSAWVLMDGEPKLTADYRGVVYSTDTGKAHRFDALGDLPVGFTVNPPPGQFYEWHDGAWQLDQSAQEAAVAAQALLDRDKHLREATLRIAPLQDAHDLGDSTVTEEAALLSWKRYRIALSRIEQQPGYPLTIDWPPVPA